MLENLFVCECNNCGGEFITNSNELGCNSCGGSEVKIIKERKAYLFNDNLSEIDLEPTELNNKINDAIAEALYHVKNEAEICSLIKDWFNENQLELPTKININLDKEWENQEEFYEYLSDVSCEGLKTELSDKLSEELKDIIDYNLSISEMKRYDPLVFTN